MDAHLTDGHLMTDEQYYQAMLAQRPDLLNKISTASTEFAAEMAVKMFRSMCYASHAGIVNSATAQGLAIPENVLAEYPVVRARFNR